MSLTTQKRNAGLVDQLTPDLQVRNEPNFAWKSVVSQFLAIPALRACWSFAAVDYLAAGQTLDQAGGGYHLTNNNVATFGYFAGSLIPIVAFDGVNQYLSRADAGAGTWADVTGAEAFIDSQQRGMTVGGWYFFDTDPGANAEACAAKWNSNAVNQRSFYLIRRTAAAGGQAQFAVSGNGIAAVTVNGPASIPGGEWHFLVGRFYPGARIDVWDNPTTPSDYQNLAVGIPAAIFDSTAAFTVGARANPDFYLDGNAGPSTFLAACALSDSIIWQLYEQSRCLFNRVYD